MPTPTTVKLGEHVLPVVPQKHARLRNKLSPEDFRAIMSRDYSTHAYRVLTILIPAMIGDNPSSPRYPEWEFDGYTSEQAWKNQEYDEELDKSPLTSEIVDAFEKALMVSGADRLGKIVSLIQTSVQVTEQQGNQLQTPASPVSLGANGESA